MQLLVRTRRRALARRARGRVLDLGGADSHASLWDAHRDVDGVADVGAVLDPALASLRGQGERFDTVFSVFRLATAIDLDETLRTVRDLLEPEGRLLFLEPTRLPGVAGRAQRAAAPATALTAGWRADRDVPAQLRASGLSVLDIERHRLRTMQWWVRSVVEGSAHLRRDLAAGAD